MAIASWNPFQEFDQVQRELNRLFHDWRGEREGWPYSRFSFLPGRAARSYPLVNVSEEGDTIRVEALAPGIDPKALKVSVLKNTVTIEGEKSAGPAETEREKVHRNERAAGRFVRTLTLPAEIDAYGVKASYHNGLLELTLPKAATARARMIEVSAN